MLHAEVVLPNLSVVNAASAAAATVSTGDLVNNSFLGLLLVLDVTALTGTTPTLQIVIEGKDAASGKYVNLATFATVNSVATFAYILGPFNPTLVAAGVSGVASSGITSAAFGILPGTFRVRVVGGGTITAASFTVGAHYIFAIG